MIARGLIIVAILALLQACTSIPVEQRPDRRAELNRTADETVAMLVEKDPSIQDALDHSVGYFTSEVSAANVALIGGAQGIGVLVDQRTGERTFLNVKRFDLGPGLGVRYFRILVIIDDPDLLEQVSRGKTFTAGGADITAGSAGTASTVAAKKGWSVHMVEDSGASVTATARMISLRVNRDLTDTGISEIGIPNIGFGIEDGFEDTERRWWDHKMPFFGQEVIDKGYDLPLPYGIKLGYVTVEQDQILENLYIGKDGSEKIPIEFVDLINAQSNSDTYQLIYDTWIFPFMNVFAILGTIDGNAPVDVLVDGNGFRDWLEELDALDCSRPANTVICNLLTDNEFLLPIDASFAGNNYGIGVNFAGGWKKLFFTLPITWVYADMDGSNTDGVSISASPRVGTVLKLGRAGNLAVYVGGSYLDTDLTVDGTAFVPGTDFGIDYRIDQQNKDKWAAILGANWDINRHWSIQAEYNGFTGSRETWIGSLTFRF